MSRGWHPLLAARGAHTPAAWPVAMHTVMIQYDECATWVPEMHVPAT